MFCLIKGDKERVVMTDSFIKIISEIWAEVLCDKDVDHDFDATFFDHGGTSTQVTLLLFLLDERLNIELDLPTFLSSPTINGVTRAVQNLQEL
jgi:acyl carrier protein